MVAVLSAPGKQREIIPNSHILSTLILASGCRRPDTPIVSPLGIPAPLDPNRPSPNRTIIRKVDNARSRVQLACAQMKALGILQVGCAEAEVVTFLRVSVLDGELNDQSALHFDSW